MRLVSDFDGVCTHPSEEARAQGDALDQALVSLLPQRQAEVRDWVARARAAALAEPTRFGWAPGGRLSAFADEDPFAAHSALLHYIHVLSEPDSMARALRAAVLGGTHGSLEALGGWSHAEGVRRVVAERGPAPLAESAAAGRRLLAAHDVVVVSNSGTKKLQDWLRAAVLPTCVHPEHRKGAIRLRGGAQKFKLDPAAHLPLALGDVTIETARAKYEAILHEEHPDAIVGDVFSLDLALPLRLKRTDPAFRQVRLFWLIRDYTPEWLRTLVAEHAPEVEPFEDGLPGVARALGV